MEHRRHRGALTESQNPIERALLVPDLTQVSQALLETLTTEERRSKRQQRLFFVSDVTKDLRHVFFVAMLVEKWVGGPGFRR